MRSTAARLALTVPLLLGLAACRGGEEEAAAPAESPSAAATTEAPAAPSAAPTTATGGGGEVADTAVPPTPKVTLAAEQGGRVDPKSWPEVCDLLTLEQFKAVLPQTTSVTTEGTKGTLIGGGGGMTPQNIACEWTLVGTGDRSPYTVDLRIDNIGSSPASRSSYDGSKASSERVSPERHLDLGSQLAPAEDAYLSSGGLAFIAGPAYLSMDSDPSGYAKTADFDLDADKRKFALEVLGPLTRAVAAAFAS